MVSLRIRRVFIRPRWWSSSSFLLAVIILILTFNCLVILFYTLIAPAWRTRNTGSDPTTASLWDDVQEPEPDCGEGKGKLLNTDWILKLIQTASKMLRNYRRKNLQRMERGEQGTALAEDDIFTLMEPLVTFISDPKNKSPDFMKMLPQLMTLWFKVQRSGMFSPSDSGMSGDVTGLGGGRPADVGTLPRMGNDAGQPPLPELNMEMLNQLLSLLPVLKT
ncbi:hypothetical protein BV898_07045 [Hypsibius exemplaris]|uniref:Uncharacterized protein n=1 Tax=Hypsibius exemplaris TaxID=2072580 RepID=A0A1W0WUY4_HYPEX|nr:hypothetical protein BV898_07045 [Hypsibius exemplaris]